MCCFVMYMEDSELFIHDLAFFSFNHIFTENIRPVKLYDYLDK